MNGAGRICVVAVLWIFFGFGGGTTRVRANPELDVGAAFLWGPIDGSLQTPRGGEPGTTSRHRPTLKEIGIDDTRTGDFWAKLTFPPHGLYLGGRLTHLSGRDTLESTLVSQGETFPAGTRVDAKVDLDWYRFGYRYRIPFDWDGRAVALYPSIGATLFNFSYKLTDTGPAVDRSYIKGGMQVGLAGTLAFTDRLDLSAQALLPIPFSTSADIFNSQLDLKYAILKDGRVGLSALVGVAYDTIRYRDNQTVSNDIKADMGPLAVVGIEATF